jgi:hypothetical protein
MLIETRRQLRDQREDLVDIVKCRLTGGCDKRNSQPHTICLNFSSKDDDTQCSHHFGEGILEETELTLSSNKRARQNFKHRQLDTFTGSCE